MQMTVLHDQTKGQEVPLLATVSVGFCNCYHVSYFIS